MLPDLASLQIFRTWQTQRVLIVPWIRRAQYPFLFRRVQSLISPGIGGGGGKGGRRGWRGRWWRHKVSLCFWLFNHLHSPDLQNLFSLTVIPAWLSVLKWAASVQLCALLLLLDCCLLEDTFTLYSIVWVPPDRSLLSSQPDNRILSLSYFTNKYQTFDAITLSSILSQNKLGLSCAELKLS